MTEKIQNREKVKGDIFHLEGEFLVAFNSCCALLPDEHMYLYVMKNEKFYNGENITADDKRGCYC